MLKKEERREMNERFWEMFKRSMRKTHSLSEKKVSWTKYPTEIKHIYLRLKCEDRISISFDIQHKDEEIRALIWEQLNELKVVLEKEMKHNTIWNEKVYTKEGMCISSISWTHESLSFYNENEWKDIISFFKIRLIEFDKFYQEYKDILIHLVN
tara:strand:+ start:657 stop:1118 length:462 start_codon:yes stop_codon:yes gene_type:complete